MRIRNVDYDREYTRQRREKNKAEFFNGKVCVKCGSSNNLELDHIDPDSKSIKSNGFWTYSKSRLEKELANCQILCHNCHVDKSSLERRRSIEHGVRATYQQGCRCASCKKANSEYEAQRSGYR